MERSCLAATVLLLVASQAFGHAFRPGMLTLIEKTPDVFSVVWKTPSGRESPDLVRPTFPPACRPLGEPMPFGDDTTRWTVDCRSGGLAGGTITMSGLGETRTDVVVRVLWQGGAPSTAVLRAGGASMQVPRTAASLGERALDVMDSYGRLGTWHIWLGIDHLLFVLGLFLLVDSTRALVATITAFTIAHSLSLALSALDLVRLPGPPVEAVIALSVLLLAVELTRSEKTPPTLTRQWTWLVAGIFGLVHGLGFAGALAEIGLPRGQVAPALLAFNLGVEVGQLVFVGALVSLALATRRWRRRWPGFRRVPAYVMGTAAVVWLLDRLSTFGTSVS